MSGSGSGSGWIPTNSDACETLTEVLPLNSPVAAVLRQLKPGDILEVDAHPINGSTVVVAQFQGAIAGTITSAIFQRIAECIENGFEYVAEVLEIQGAVCKVRVRTKVRFAVVGGVYRELCRFPRSDETWGSGGRAAAVIAGLGIPVDLYTAIDTKANALLSSLAYTFHFGVHTTQIPATYRFQYDHGLSVPLVWPTASEEKSLLFDVHSENALVFGMLEATPNVFAKQIVYDPQSPNGPVPFIGPSGTPPSAIAYVLNSVEARQLGRSEDIIEAASMIAESHHLDVVVVKCGPRGAIVYERGRTERIPAYATNEVWPIGSGDVFAAVFAARWAIAGATAIEAAGQASRAAAQYVNDRILPIPEDILDLKREFSFPAIQLRAESLDGFDYHVYLAGPFFNIGQSWLLEEARLALRAMGLKVFSPSHDVGLGAAQEVAPRDLEAIRRSRTVFALIDGLDAGTIFEVGYARSLQIPVIALAQSTPEEPLKMIAGSGCKIVSDFVTGIYQTSWAAQT